MADQNKGRVATVPDDGSIGRDEARTLGGLFRLRVQRTPEAPAYRHYAAPAQAWRVWTWRDIAAYVARFQHALRGMDLEPGDRLAIMLPNGPDWVAADQAALGLGLVVVPLHLDHQPSTVAYILAHSGARVLLLQNATAWRRLQAQADALDGLERVIVAEGPVSAKDPRLVERDRWLPGSASRLAARDDDPNALATIIYPPGGAHPRGVMLSHGNLLWNAWACARFNRAGPGDLALSFLPLAHSLERTAGYYQAMLQGVEVAFSRSSGMLLEDMAALRPTVMLSVPRIFERIFARLTQEAADRGRGSRALWDAAQRIGYSRFERRQGRAGWRPSHLAWPLLDQLVARRVRAVFGGRLRFTVSSGAALSPRIARLFLGCGVDLRQAYALTEAGPMVSCNPGDANEPASVGVALPDVRVRMQQNGELLVNSPGVMQGYWQDPRATRKVIDETGWLHTGDRVAGLERKRLYLSGRFKGIVVMSTGEKVAPMELEQAIAADPAIGQVMALGEGRPYMAALVVLEPSSRGDYLAGLGLDSGDSRAHQSEALEADLLGRIAARLRDFPRYAQVRRVAVMPQPWTVENGFLTPTGRIRRRRVLDANAATVSRLYEGHAGAQLTTLARNLRVAG